MANNVVAVVKVATLPLPSLSIKHNAFTFRHKIKSQKRRLHLNFSQTNYTTTSSSCSFSSSPLKNKGSSCFVVACLPSPSESSNLSSSTTPSSSTKLYVSGLSFRTTEESLRNAFKNFGQLVEVNLVMDKIANRPRGFAFLRYAAEEESRKAIEGMHGKFLDGRVIFVEVAKPRSELRQRFKQDTRL
ncbi:organelle RRM domain-containing protein 6, chloroplastic isoform X2 [Abrus precatorius]|uniref:Organelle RRM domain-containing protein 6, chloroplastic isoform X2 n=1 Tax=Abrus precatorius TaxID=3816 RepID=A0A8B8LUY9_ABRPR|nr:organelle RRM domain-containing protein 6, chloroplastic isoform X2 [Abrus precatorius]